LNIELQQATFLRRYKRFLADVRLEDGSELTVHCPNSGSMKTLLTPEQDCAIYDSANPKRKLRFTLTYLKVGFDQWALVDTQRPNAMAEEAIHAGWIKELCGYSSLKREVKYGSENSRIDLLLSHPDRSPCYVEVKNCTMAAGQPPHLGQFPDSVTTRGAKHLRELTQICRQGGRAVMLYLLNREDLSHCGIAEQIDPSYARHLREALSAGVEVLCYRSKLSLKSMSISESCPFLFDS
jgi:sugar fermentation stimulation protein A